MLCEARRAGFGRRPKASVHVRAGSTDTYQRFLAVFRRENLNDSGAAETATSTPSRRDKKFHKDIHYTTTTIQLSHE